MYNIVTLGRCYKTFFRTFQRNQVSLFDPAKPFQTSLIFASKAWVYLSVTPERGYSLVLASATLPVNITLGWECLPGTNTYLFCPTIML